jgi:hypothetical protein
MAAILSRAASRARAVRSLHSIMQQAHGVFLTTGARYSILDIARRLTPVLLGLPLILPALRIAFLVCGAAFLLGVS